MRHAPATADWGPTLELTVSEGALPLTRMVTPEPAAPEGCSLAPSEAGSGFALLVRLQGMPPADAPRLRVFDWRDGRLVERTGQ